MFFLKHYRKVGAMEDKPFVIGVFVSSPSVGDRIKRIATQRDSIIKISYDNLTDAILPGKKMEQEGVEVLVSRRGTAHLLRENLHIPVLSLPQNSMSLLASIREARKKGRKIFLPCFRNKHSGLEIIEDLFDVEFAQGIYTDLASLRQIIAGAAQKGFEVVIGGLASMSCATEFGMKFHELLTSTEEVRDTIESAKSVARSQRQQKGMARRYQAIMDATSDGIIANDAAGILTTINRTAERLLNIRGQNAVGASIAHFLPQSVVNRVLQGKKEERDKVERVNDQMFIFNHIPVILDGQAIGVVSSFQEISHVMRAENSLRRTLAKGFVAKYLIDDLIYQHPSMEKVVRLCREFSKTDSSILISGETGTGKEIIAQSIHNLSRRKTRPFVSVHCGALPEQLLESELFGYEEGAFTGSKKGGKPGLFELAHQGTMFLDEIDSTSPSVQMRLLRVLQEREVMRVGADHTIPIDVRVIAAAGKDLWNSVQEGDFRKDLFFRLNVLRISIPPLRARNMDIPRLLDHFLRYFGQKYKLDPIAIPGVYIQKLMSYSWPGNVRQLRHFAEQLLLNCSFQYDEEILDTLFDELSLIVDRKQEPPVAQTENIPAGKEIQMTKRLGRETLLAALEGSRYNKTRASEMLGIGRTTLWRKMKEFHLD